MRIPELKELCRARGIKVTGTKATLIERIAADDKALSDFLTADPPALFLGLDINTGSTGFAVIDATGATDACTHTRSPQFTGGAKSVGTIQTDRSLDVLHQAKAIASQLQDICLQNSEEVLPNKSCQVS